MLTSCVVAINCYCVATICDRLINAEGHESLGKRKTMKYVIGLMVAAGLFLFLYNSNLFNSYLRPERFYENIYCGPYNVTETGASLTIPITYTFATTYGLSIVVPGDNLFQSSANGNGTLKYSFISNGQTIAQGSTIPPKRENLVVREQSSYVDILFFDLPLPKAGSELQLRLVVERPFVFLKSYEGNIRCCINPSYNPK